MADIAEQPRRGRPPKVETERRERRARRRKEGEVETQGLTLPIPDWVKEKYPEKEYRYYWFRDTPGRLHGAHKNDWDAVDGTGTRVPGAKDEHGNPVNHVLHVKYRDWYEQDRGLREKGRKEMEEQMKRGVVHARDDDGGETLSQSVQYEEASASNRLS